MNCKAKVLVRAPGFEPGRNTPADFKSDAATSYAMPAYRLVVVIFTLPVAGS